MKQLLARGSYRLGLTIRCLHVHWTNAQDAASISRGLADDLIGGKVRGLRYQTSDLEDGNRGFIGLDEQAVRWRSVHCFGVEA